jgi:hypothetical protein
LTLSKTTSGYPQTNAGAHNDSGTSRPQLGEGESLFAFPLHPWEKRDLPIISYPSR